MYTVSFELKMPNAGAWNGKWTGANRQYFIIKKITTNVMKRSYFKRLVEDCHETWYYNFGDGWTASVRAEIIHHSRGKERREISSGFAGYDWMVDSIISFGNIIPDSKLLK